MQTFRSVYHGELLKIFNTLTRTKEEFRPIEPGRVRMYVCGMTVYDYCHIGHARVMVVFDMVSRWLRASGLQVTYVRNITDIDDKIIKRAVENQESIAALTNRFIAAMNEDAALLGVLPPDHEPRATQYIPQMLDLIGQLEKNGLAYQAQLADHQPGDVNFSVRAFDGYGKLSGKSLDELRAGERVSVADGKKDPLDFVLWKKSKADEPAEVKWPSPWGEGRPGWHIECSAMSCSLLGQHFDIHGGGADLQFPHHENEIAQSEGAFHQPNQPNQSNKPFVNTWMHNGFVRIDNEKMSKSLGNFFTIRQVLEQFDPEVIRFFILRAHYRSPLNYSDTHLEDARQGLGRLYTALASAGVNAGVSSAADHSNTLTMVQLMAACPNQPAAQSAIKAFTQAMDDDFNTPVAIAALFDLASEINRASAAGAGNAAANAAELAVVLRQLAGVLGLLARSPEDFHQAGRAMTSGLSPQAIEALIQARADAKKAKDFARADQIRADLLAQGVVLEDSPAGTTWRNL
jgi:cysteinyl-tRNA synthetase